MICASLMWVHRQLVWLTWSLPVFRCSQNEDQILPKSWMAGGAGRSFALLTSCCLPLRRCGCTSWADSGSQTASPTLLLEGVVTSCCSASCPASVPPPRSHSLLPPRSVWDPLTSQNSAQVLPSQGWHACFLSHTLLGNGVSFLLECSS